MYLLYDDSLPEQGRNFANKIWNAFRLLKSWTVSHETDQPVSSALAVKWMNETLKKGISGIDSDFRRFRISEALMAVYKLFWDDFSGWYLEIIKPDYQKPVDKVTLDATIYFFDTLLRLIHPFMPFITEEIWQLLTERKEGESIMVSRMPEPKKYNKELISGFERVKETVTAIRSLRKEKEISNKEKIVLYVRHPGIIRMMSLNPVIARLCNLSDVIKVDTKPEGSASFLIGTTEYYVPLGDNLNVEEEIRKIKADLIYYRGFLESVMKKLTTSVLFRTHLHQFWKMKEKEI
jgi:valyl-tRNA synthetase